jgi:polygalacturonase
MTLLEIPSPNEAPPGEEAQQGADRCAAQTRALQSAIDRCARAGGGVVRVAPGVHEIGTLRLADRVTLWLASGAILRGSGRIEDYPDDASSFVDAVGQPRGRALIVAHNVVDAGIEGEGVIDGFGAAFKTPRTYPQRPFLVRFVGCRDMRISGVSLRDSAAWVLHLMDCDGVRVRDIVVRSHVNHNNDGIDIDSCRDVEVVDCDIDTGDDAICLKSTLAKPCEDIRVTRCRLRSRCGAIKLGTESYGDMRRIVIEHCRIDDAGLSGIKIISMDGAVIDDVRISDITMSRGTGPIFVRLGARLRTYATGDVQKTVGAIRNVTIERIDAAVQLPPAGGTNYFTREPLPPSAFAGVLVTGVPGHAIESLHITDIRLHLPGGLSSTPAVDPPDMIDSYPEQFYFGTLPAHGFFIRHVRGVCIERATVELTSPDARPVVALRDVTNACVEVNDIVHREPA